MHAAQARSEEVVADGLPGPALARHMLVVDPPDHTRLRRLASPAFSKRRVAALETRVRSVVDHLLSTFVFVAFVVEFLLVKGAAHSVFFTLMVISLVDLLSGFTVSIRAAGRDVNVS